MATWVNPHGSMRRTVRRGFNMESGDSRDGGSGRADSRYESSVLRSSWDGCSVNRKNGWHRVMEW